ncbi:MAG TPA: hypothetical protein VF587_15480 [Solirubrobacteraceae bacterium]
MSGSERLRAGRVADPVHGYVTLTPIERVLIDTPVAQRLRYVSQSGLAHLVFPEVRTSRFSHSLGAMHLASRFLSASLENADESTRDALTSALQAIVREVESVADVRQFRDVLRHGLATPAVVPEQEQPWVMIVEQGLRLAALFHDIGHLPLSHDFEYALRELAAEGGGARTAELEALVRQHPGGEKLHERIGHAVGQLLLRSVFSQLEADTQTAARVTFGVAAMILQTATWDAGDPIPAEGGPRTPSAEAALRWLRSLIAGELDVDRCDYVLRDARNYGFEFAIYDLTRLADNLTVVQDGSDPPRFIEAVLPRGQSAVETLLVARSRMYQYGVRHHKVAQIGAALRYEIVEMLRPALLDTGRQRGGAGLADFVDDVAAVLAADPGHLGADQAGELLARFATYDDVWWMERMRAEAAERPDDEWLQLVCWRAKGPKSLWKRVFDFPGGPERLYEWNQRLPEIGSQTAGLFEESIRQLRQDRVLVTRQPFEPWKPDDADPPESRLQFFIDGDLVPVTRVSSLVAALRDVWMHDVQVQAFAPNAESAITAEEVVEKLTFTEDR